MKYETQIKSALRLIFFILLPSSFFLFCGCSCPHRSASTLHTREQFQGRPDGLVLRETWKDREAGGGYFLLADPNVQSMLAIHTNQTALGGGSVFSAGTLTITVDTNTASVLGAGGTALGNIIGAAAKSTIK